jgi:tryptophanyl-tRNA synthetase
MADEKLPGVTLWWHGCTEKKGIKHRTATVILNATIESEAVWTEVQEKLQQGFRIYSVDDFKTEMISALNQELQDEQAKRQALEQELGQVKYQNGVLQTTLAKHRGFLAGFKRLFG